MTRGDNEKMANPPLIPGNEYRNSVRATKDGEGPITTEVVTERTGIIVGQINTAIGHEFTSLVRNACNSGRLILRCAFVGITTRNF